ncbi:MAG: dihydroorotate dehydrogenase electron transfer subunit, partial [Promethearchaeota archaeon]
MFMRKIKKGWKELEAEIIESNKCVYCGACGAFCSNIRFNRDTEKPFEDGSCEEVNTCRNGYGVCYNLCPKTGIDRFPVHLLDNWVFGEEHDKILGHYIKILKVKPTNFAKKQINSDINVIPAILAASIKANLIDSAIANKTDKYFRPIPYIANNKEDLLPSFGYNPFQAPTLSLIGEAINQGNTDIAVVGNPCQIQALRKIQNHPRFDFEAYDLVTLAIGTFCFGTFHNQRLRKILEEYDIESSSIKKVERDDNNFNLNFFLDSKIKQIPLNILYDKAIRDGCFSCSDYSASFSDISIGKIESNNDWEICIIRTKRGNKIIELAKEMGYIETASLGKDKKTQVIDMTRNKIDIVKIEKIDRHSPDIKSFWIRNSRVAKAYKPGNFLILWLPDIDFLPMSVSQVDGDLLEITVERIGSGTSALFNMNVGDKIGIRGPYGNAWNYEDASKILIIGGGMGIAALTSVLEPLKGNKKNVYIAIGAKNQNSLIFEKRIKELIPDTLCTTDDGSIGQKCYVTDPIPKIIRENNIDLIFTCGPEIMMKKVLKIAQESNIELQASLERKMKSGVGICGSCCIGEENNVCVCKDGPIFTLEQLKSFPHFGSY